MIPSQNFYKLLEQFEGLKLYAYQDSAGIWTIGIGTTFYPNGTPVKQGDQCTITQAQEWARYEGGKKAVKLNGILLDTEVSQNQFDALLSLCYNIGSYAFSNSTLLHRIKAFHPTAPDYKEVIREGFCLWDKATVNGKKEVIPGLLKRRNKEADLFLK